MCSLLWHWEREIWYAIVFPMQLQLLTNGFRLLRVGGTLVYSTCRWVPLVANHYFVGHEMILRSYYGKTYLFLSIIFMYSQHLPTMIMNNFHKEYLWALCYCYINENFLRCSCLCSYYSKVCFHSICFVMEPLYQGLVWLFYTDRCQFLNWLSVTFYLLDTANRLEKNDGINSIMYQFLSTWEIFFFQRLLVPRIHFFHTTQISKQDINTILIFVIDLLI